MTDRQRAVIDGEPTDLETRIAKCLWHRWGSPSVEDWEDETHKAEYLDAAVEVLIVAGRTSNMPEWRDYAEKLDEYIRKDGSAYSLALSALIEVLEGAEISLGTR